MWRIQEYINMGLCNINKITMTNTEMAIIKKKKTRLITTKTYDNYCINELCYTITSQ